ETVGCALQPASGFTRIEDVAASNFNGADHRGGNRVRGLRRLGGEEAGQEDGGAGQRPGGGQTALRKSSPQYIGGSTDDADDADDPRRGEVGRPACRGASRRRSRIETCRPGLSHSGDEIERAEAILQGWDGDGEGHMASL